MEYMTTVQAGEKWGITPNRISILAKEGRIAGAKQIGGRWMIPEETEKPADGRRKATENACCKADRNRGKGDDVLFFRYPYFEFRDPASVTPPLDEEELQLKAAMEAFHALRFSDVRRLLGDLVVRTENRYHRITALYTACMAAIYTVDVRFFLTCYSRLQGEMQEDFPHKKEMLSFIYEINATLGVNNSLIERLDIDSDYEYGESYLPHLVSICLFSLSNDRTENLPQNLMMPYELHCRAFEGQGYYKDLQTMHLYLGITYAIAGKTREQHMHIHKALEYAQKYGMFYIPVSEAFNFRNFLDPVLADFPESFRSEFLAAGKELHRRYTSFQKVSSLNNISGRLNQNDYIYLVYALQGYKNKKIAQILHISENTVSKRYSAIYEELGIKNKQELVKLALKNMDENYIRKLR